MAGEPHPSATRRALVLGLATLPGLAQAGEVGAGDGLARRTSLGCGASGACAPPTNVWPDPQFCIQDLSGLLPALNEHLTNQEPPIEVIGHSTGTFHTTCFCSDTGGLRIGDWLQFMPGADTCLTKTLLRVEDIRPNRSFSVCTEFTSGKPAASTTCRALPVQHGASSTVGGGSVTSNVQRYADGKVWPEFRISRRIGHTSLLRSCKRVLVVKKVTDLPEIIYWQADAETLATLRSTRQAVGFACHVVTPAKGVFASAFINTGASVESDEVATAPARAWLTSATDVAGSATIFQCGTRLHGPAGSTFVLGEYTRCAAAGALPDGSFSTPTAQTVIALASVSPWVGAAFTIPTVAEPPVVPVATNFVCDVEQMSSGVIGEGVSYWMGLIEGQGAYSEVLGSHTVGSAIVFNPLLHQLIDPADKPGQPKYYAYASGNFNCRGGKLLFYGSPAAKWRFVSWDIHGFVLFAGP